MSPVCPSWPDLMHTFIQQVFIKRLFVQGTSGEGIRSSGFAPLPRQRRSLLESLLGAHVPARAQALSW